MEKKKKSSKPRRSAISLKRRRAAIATLRAVHAEQQAINKRFTKREPYAVEW